MKKQNLKSLKLNKKSISSLKNEVKGAEGTYFSCIGGYCLSDVCISEITCNSVWKDALCTAIGCNN